MKACVHRSKLAAIHRQSFRRSNTRPIWLPGWCNFVPSSTGMLRYLRTAMEALMPRPFRASRNAWRTRSRSAIIDMLLSAFVVEPPLGEEEMIG